MPDEQPELTIEHLTAALAHAEGYLRAVRAALDSLAGQEVRFPPGALTDALVVRPFAPRPSAGCSILTGTACRPEPDNS